MSCLSGDRIRFLSGMRGGGISLIKPCGRRGLMLMIQGRRGGPRRCL